MTVSAIENEFFFLRNWVSLLPKSSPSFVYALPEVLPHLWPLEQHVMSFRCTKLQHDFQLLQGHPVNLIQGIEQAPALQ